MIPNLFLYGLLAAAWLLRLVSLPLELLGLLREPPRPALESSCRPRARPMALPKDRSLAIGQLYEAVRLRSQANDKTEKEKTALDRMVYDACLRCYEQKVTRTDVRVIIDAVVSEFRQAVA